MSEHTINDSRLGCTKEGETYLFRLFAPRATHVTLHLFRDYADPSPATHVMEKRDDGVWELSIEHDLSGKLYAYDISFPDSALPYVEKTDHLIADPFSKHVVCRNSHLQHARTLINETAEFRWSDRDFYPPSDPRDLIIYECHIKDMVAHPTAKTYANGIYNDFVDAQRGGLKYIKELGVNAVEFLPLQKYAYFEPPFGVTTGRGVKNTWNPYSVNHWGYMTSFYHAPETLFSSSSSYQPNEISGAPLNASRELKRVVNELHRNKICVLMDVVYNHASHYDLNPLKFSAKDHYFRLDDAGHYINDSWTGNDINTSAKHSRELILQSLIHWVKEYHIDGFRFDLAGLIDWETVDLISSELKKVKPNIILIAEPWGGSYKPDGFSDHNWASWNDRMRNNFKGYDPLQDKGYIFGNFNHHVSRFAIENGIRGSLRKHDHGLFRSSRHSVNYFESHDGYTLSDYIRLVLEPEYKDRIITDPNEHTRMNDEQIRISKLAALILFVSQGIVMIHEGQEFGRSKVIRSGNPDDTNVGKIDRDTYNKDNETNWINFDQVSLNADLYGYYKGLILLRKMAPALRKAAEEEINFKVYQDPLHVTFSVDGHGTDDKYDYFISVNANPETDHEIILPDGYWELVADYRRAGVDTIRSFKSSYEVKARSGAILRKLRVNNA